MKTVPGFTMLSGRPVMVLHSFYATADGQLAHETDGTLRATVPPEGWADYCQQYPDAQDVVDSLTIKPLPIDRLLSPVALLSVPMAMLLSPAADVLSPIEID